MLGKWVTSFLMPLAGPLAKRISDSEQIASDYDMKALAIHTQKLLSTQDLDVVQKVLLEKLLEDLSYLEEPASGIETISHDKISVTSMPEPHDLDLKRISDINTQTIDDA